MSGSWHLYRRGERWQRPRHQLRVLVEAANGWQAVCFNAPEVEMYRRSREPSPSVAPPDPAGDGRDRRGPAALARLADLCEPDADLDAVLARLARLVAHDGAVEVGDALLEPDGRRRRRQRLQERGVLRLPARPVHAAGRRGRRRPPGALRHRPPACCGPTSAPGPGAPTPPASPSTASRAGPARAAARRSGCAARARTPGRRTGARRASHGPPDQGRKPGFGRRGTALSFL